MGNKELSLSPSSLLSYLGHLVASLCFGWLICGIWSIISYLPKMSCVRINYYIYAYTLLTENILYCFVFAFHRGRT